MSYDNCEPVLYEIVKDIGYGCGEAVIKSLKEKWELEKKYKVPSTKYETNYEVIDCKFKLAK